MQELVSIHQLRLGAAARERLSMTFVAQELVDPAPARPALDVLAKLNSEHIDLDAESQLSHARFWVAHSGDLGTPVAYALIWLLGSEAEIVDVATAPAWRRQGAASALLRAIESRCRELGIDAIYLEVRATNQAAIALYTAFGFEQMRVRRRYYADGEDAWDMRKTLVE